MYLAACIALGIIMAVVAIPVIPYIIAIIASIFYVVAVMIGGAIQEMINCLRKLNRKVRRRL